MLLLATDNLFFRADDGTVLAVRIRPTLGPELLHGLSQSGCPPSQVSSLPLASTPYTAVDNNSASDAQTQPSSANASAQLSSPASDANRAAYMSSSRSAADPPASSAFSSTLRPNSGAGIVNANAWVDRIFSSADGEGYDRDWMSDHNVNNDVLEGTPSKHKLNVLVKNGAVIVGDKLCVTYHSSGNSIIIEGEVSIPLVSWTQDLSNPVFPLGPTKLHERQLVRSNRACSSKLRRHPTRRPRPKRLGPRNE